MVFAWMGEGQPTEPEDDLPPELFDESVVFHDTTIWHANWAPSLENMNDNHVRYTHRNSVLLGLRPFAKMSYDGARPIFSGGGVTLTHYTDDSLKERPYQEYFPGVEGLWPKHRYRLMWGLDLQAKLHAMDLDLRKRDVLGSRRCRCHAVSSRQPRIPVGVEPGSSHARDAADQWFERSLHPLGRSCRRIHRREFYFYAVKPRTGLGRWWEAAKYPPLQKLLRNRNLGFQDGVVLEGTRYDTPERYSAFDVETVAWRRLAILSARHGGRHDMIPPEVIERLNRPAFELLTRAGKESRIAAAPERDLQLR